MIRVGTGSRRIRQASGEVRSGTAIPWTSRLGKRYGALATRRRLSGLSGTLTRAITGLKPTKHTSTVGNRPFPAG